MTQTVRIRDGRGQIAIVHQKREVSLRAVRRLRGSTIEANMGRGCKSALRGVTILLRTLRKKKSY